MLIAKDEDSTPKKNNVCAVCETFAEMFRHINGKINDEKTVELYFNNFKNLMIEVLYEKYGLH